MLCQLVSHAVETVEWEIVDVIRQKTWTLFIRLSELLPLLVFREIISRFVYAFDCMSVCNIYSIPSGRIFNCSITVLV